MIKEVLINILRGSFFLKFLFYRRRPVQTNDREVKGLLQIRSSAWLEHYTDNVGVSSSNLLGSTIKVIG